MQYLLTGCICLHFLRCSLHALFDFVLLYVENKTGKHFYKLDLTKQFLLNAFPLLILLLLAVAILIFICL